MKLKRGEVYGIKQCINLLDGKYNTRFLLKLDDIINILNPYAESIEEKMKTGPNKGFLQFEYSRNKIMEEFADKDEQGNPVIKRNPFTQNEVFVISNEENKIKSKEKIEKLLEEHKDDIEDFKNQEKELNEIMEDEVEINIPLISLKYFPEEISTNDFAILKTIIDRSEEE